MNKQLGALVNFTRRVFASHHFMYVLVTITVLQALWYALSFSPWINDEPKHFRTTELFTSQVTPFFSEQPTSWDSAGQVTRSGSYLFYYMMSWPLRGLQAITDDTQLQLLGLRLLMIILFVCGLVMYRKALLNIEGLSVSLVHVALLAFVLTPAVGLLAGMFNYDNLAFVLFAVLLYLSVQVLYAKRVLVATTILVSIVAALLVLVKWSALALVVPLLLLLAYSEWSHHKQNYIKQFSRGFGALSTPVKVALLLGLLVSLVLVVERPVQNLLLYGKPNPACDVVLSHARCMKHADYANYFHTLAAKDPDFTPLSLPGYFVRYWVPHMADKAANLIERGADSRLAIVAALYLFCGVVSLGIIAFGRSRILHNRGLVFILLLSLFYVVVLIVKEYMVYAQYGIPGAVRTRYLVPVLPLYFSVVLYTLWPLILRYKRWAVLVGIVGLLLLAQGGSIITHLFTAPPGAYSSQTSRTLNRYIKTVLSPFIYHK